MKKSPLVLLPAIAILLLTLFSCQKKASIVLTDPDIINGELRIGIKLNHQILYTVEPEGTSVTWTSDNPSAAYVLGDWLVANAAGSAVITGTTPDGETCSFIADVVPLEVKSFNMPSSLAMFLGETKDIEITDILPAVADASSIYWTYSCDGIVSHEIEGNTLHLTALWVDKVVLTGTGTGGAKKTCSIEVKEKLIDSFDLSKSEVTMDKGGSARIDILNIRPVGAPASRLEWDILPGGAEFEGQWDGDTMVITATPDCEYGEVAEIYFNNKQGMEKVCVLKCKMSPHPVDLGLPVMWADINLGANGEADAGNYYEWGKTSPQTAFPGDDSTWDNYYNSSRTLLPKDDAATQALGEGWRIPSDREFIELISKQNDSHYPDVMRMTEVTWTYRNTSSGKVYGYEIRGILTGNSIFLPASGYYDLENSGQYTAGEPTGTYWCNRSYNNHNKGEYDVYSFTFSPTNLWMSVASAFYGRTIRAVYDPKTEDK